MGDGVMRLLQGGAIVVVLRPADRQEIVAATHQGMGHFGVQRVLDRLWKNYWWRNMGDLVVRVIQACHACARVKAGFRESGKVLGPLPLVTSVPIASTPNPHLCASSVCSVVPSVRSTILSSSANLVIPYSSCVH